MSRPLLEVADLVRSAGAAFIGRNRSLDPLDPYQGPARHRALSHRRTRRSHR